MKNIKSYKIFESKTLPSGVSEETIKEICYEITDDGRFNYVLKKHKIDYYILISLVNPLDYDGFKFSEIKDCVLRLRHYLGDHYYTCSVLCVGDVHWSLLDLSIDENDMEKYDKKSILNLSIFIW